VATTLVDKESATALSGTGTASVKAAGSSNTKLIPNSRTALMHTAENNEDKK